jgi:hypothetical protein
MEALQEAVLHVPLSMHVPPMTGRLGLTGEDKGG